MDSKIKRNRIVAIVVIVVMVLAMAGTFFLSASRMKTRGFGGQFNGQKPDFSQEIEDGNLEPPTKPEGDASSDSTDNSGNDNTQPPSMPDNGNFKAPGSGASGIIFNVCYAVEGILLGMAAMYLIMTRDKSEEEDEDNDEEDVLHC